MKSHNWRVYPQGSAERVLAHGIVRTLRGKRPSMSYGEIRNPRDAQKAAFYAVMFRRIGESDVTEAEIGKGTAAHGKEYQTATDYRKVADGTLLELTPVHQFNPPLSVHVIGAQSGFWGIAEEADIPPSTVFVGSLNEAPLSEIGIDTSKLVNAPVAGVIYPRGTTILFYAGDSEQADILFSLAVPFGA